MDMPVDMDSRRERLALLLRRRGRRAKAHDVVKHWAGAGVSASVISDSYHEDLVDRLRTLPRKRRCATGFLSNTLTAFARRTDIAIVIACWDLDCEPGILIPSHALAQLQPFLRTVYPDGFVVVSQPLTRALVIDFGDDGTEIDFHLFI
jgi:hypothetical protein